MIDTELLIAIKDTFIMVLIPTICAVFLGVPLGAVVFLTDKGGIRENKFINILCNIYINVVRSFLFLIFVVILIPLTQLIFGTAFGLFPASFPICFVAVGFTEQSFYDVNSGIIDAALSMKASVFQIVWHFLLVDARSSLVLGLTSAIISFISYSIVMGVVGGGGIGDYAMRYGYNEYNHALIYRGVTIMIVIVFSIQIIGNRISKNKVAIPNDVTNQDRALRILANEGLIDLKPKDGLYNLNDVINTKKNFKFMAVPIPSLVQAYQEADLAFNWPSHMLKIGVHVKDALFIEKNTNGKYAVSLVAREDNKNSKKIQDLTKAMTSEKVKKFIEEKYDGQGFPVF